MEINSRHLVRHAGSGYRLVRGAVARARARDGRTERAATVEGSLNGWWEGGAGERVKQQQPSEGHGVLQQKEA